MPAYLRCPWCGHLDWNKSTRECEGCGFNGCCRYCAEPVSADGPHPQHHDGVCAWQAAEEDRADELVDMADDR